MTKMTQLPLHWRALGSDRLAEMLDEIDSDSDVYDDILGELAKRNDEDNW